MTVETPRQSNETVASIMSKNVVTCQSSQNIIDAARRLVENRVGALPIVDEMGVCVGILTATDIVRFEVERQANDDSNNFGLEATLSKSTEESSWQIGIEPLARVSRFMNSAVQTIDANSPISLAARMMRQEKIHHLVVLDQQRRPVGVVSSLDLLPGP